MGKGPSVVIVGGGVAGLTAAHELVERNFEVSLYEHRWHCGGKAASARVSVSGVNQLPGEHGFHFFPGWYRHLPDTLGRIPSDRHRGEVGQQSVLDHLVTVGSNLLASYSRDPIPIVLHAPRSADQAQKLLAFLVQTQRMGLSMTDAVVFFGKLRKFLSLPDELRRPKYDNMAWTEFVGLDERTSAFQILTAHTRCLIAANPHEASAYTIATMAIRTLFESSFPLDRVLDGPTSEVWIEPWVRYLEGQGVTFHLGHDLDQVTFTGASPQVASLQFSPVDDRYLEAFETGRGSVHEYAEWRRARERPEEAWPESPEAFRHKLHGGWMPALPDDAVPVTADYYLFALPIEQMAYYVNRSSMMTYYDGSLRNILRLTSSVDWMAGIQFYFRAPINLEPGHIVCADSEWSLTAIDQTHFWRGRAIPPGVQSILSVDISAWNKKGRYNGKEAFRCSRIEIAEEVFAQLAASFNRTSRPTLLDPKMLLSGQVSGSYHLDDNVAERYDIAKQAEYVRAQAVRFSADEALAQGAGTEEAPFLLGERNEMNVEPILINRPGGLALRPSAHSHAITNLFLAGDYLDTATNLACMEGANEAGRLAVNALIEQAGSNYARCRLWDFSDRDVLSTVANVATMLRQGPSMQKAIDAATSAATTLGGIASRAAQSLLQAWNKR